MILRIWSAKCSRNSLNPEKPRSLEKRINVASETPIIPASSFKGLKVAISMFCFTKSAIRW